MQFTIPRELLEAGLRNELEQWIQRYTGSDAGTREILEQIAALPESPPIEHLRVDRDPRPERRLFRKIWHWRVHASRRLP